VAENGRIFRQIRTKLHEKNSLKIWMDLREIADDFFGIIFGRDWRLKNKFNSMKFYMESNFQGGKRIHQIKDRDLIFNSITLVA
jgi:hypothetical protein